MCLRGSRPHRRRTVNPDSMGAVRITSLNPKFNGSHVGLPPSSVSQYSDTEAGLSTLILSNCFLLSSCLFWLFLLGFPSSFFFSFLFFFLFFFHYLFFLLVFLSFLLSCFFSTTEESPPISPLLLDNPLKLYHNNNNLFLLSWVL